MRYYNNWKVLKHLASEGMNHIKIAIDIVSTHYNDKVIFTIPVNSPIKIQKDFNDLLVSLGISFTTDLSENIFRKTEPSITPIVPPRNVVFIVDLKDFDYLKIVLSETPLIPYEDIALSFVGGEK